MSSTEPNQAAPAFVPATDDPLTGQDALAALQNAIDGRSNPLDLVITPDPTTGQPIGRSWAYDFRNDDGAAPGGFVKTPGALSPLPTSDMETLRNWVVKCLNTSRGAHPVHPPGYGMVTSSQSLIGAPVGQVPADLFDRIEDALGFHPRISSLQDFDYTSDPDDDRVFVQFTVVLDDESELAFNRLGLSF